MGYQDDIRIILLGKTGSGKSSTGNSILGQRNIFAESCSAKSVTRRGRRGRMKYNGKDIQVVDTPGLFDTEMDKDTLKLEILKCFALIAPGPHVILYVISIGRFTEESIKAEKEFLEMFQGDVFKFTVIVLTGKDNNDYHEISDQHYLENVPDPFKEFIHKCGDRVLFINNRLPNKMFTPMWQKMYEIIIKMMETRSDTFYTNCLLKGVEKEIEATVDSEIKRKNSKNSKKVIREKLIKNAESGGSFLKYLSKKTFITTAVLGLLWYLTGSKAIGLIEGVSGLTEEQIRARGRCSLM